MPTAFGPQGYNATTTRTAGNTNRYGLDVDTWVQDCAPDGQGGTILDAQFFNMILGNIRQVVYDANTDGASIIVSDGDMTLLSQAIQHFAGGTTLQALDGIDFDGTAVALDFSALTDPGIDPADSSLAFQIVSNGNIHATSPFSLVGSVLNPGTNVTFTSNAATGQIDVSVDLTNYIPATRAVIAGVGLTGGGSLGADVTVSLDILGLPSVTTSDADLDFIPIHDATFNALRKISVADMVASIIPRSIIIGSII